MRLIDADAFAEISKNHVPEVIVNTWDEGYIDCLKVVDETPTVEAIPIDWLVTKAKEMVLTQGTKFYSILDLPIVYDLIREWRKENETN